MNPKVKTKWLKALRSGDFRKTTNVLKRFFKTVEPRYCCLGVLCEITKDEFPEAADHIKRRESEAYGISHPRSGTSMMAMLSEKMREHTGINSDQQRKIATKNDNGESFAHIADYIEKHL